MKSNPYLCRWPNGDFSIVVAATRQDAVAQLDEWAGAEVASLIPLDLFMAHFHLNDAGEIELAEFGEETEGRIWSECYPDLDDVISSKDAVGYEDGECTSEACAAIREAVNRERHRSSMGCATAPTSNKRGKGVKPYAT